MRLFLLENAKPLSFNLNQKNQTFPMLHAIQTTTNQ